MSIIEDLIAHFDLQPLPEEGGLFRRTYAADEIIPLQGLPERYAAPKLFGSAIVYLLTSESDSFSALHRLPTDEFYHFYLGDPVELLLLYPNGDGQRVVLGPDVLNGQRVQFTVPRAVWQGSRLIPGGEYALLGTTMAPAYDDDDFELGPRETLLAQYPERAELIAALTR
jgi:predicted cupin superfamily sugar epimerase